MAAPSIFMSLRLPRFQFFYDTNVLLKAMLRLPIINSQKIEKQEFFLKRMCQLFERQHAQIVSSFRMGLFYSLKSLELNPGDEVLLAPLTIADTINAIKLAGLTPVFVDLDPDTHCISMADLQKKITAKSKVLLVTYLSGIVPDIDALTKLTKDHKLTLIEDISQNMDATYKGHKVGSHGDISIASLSCGKNISTLFGGLILCNDQIQMNKIKNEFCFSTPRKTILSHYLLNCLKVQIATSRLLFPNLVYPLIHLLSRFNNQFPAEFNHDPEVKNNIFRSHNPKLRTSFPEEFYAPVNDWQLDLVEHQLMNLSEGTQKRRNLAKVLLENLSARALKQIPLALMNTEGNSFYHFPIHCTNSKSRMRKHLFLNGIDNGSYGLNLCSEEKSLGHMDNNLPGAHAVKHETIFLPIHESYNAHHMRHIARIVNEFLVTDNSHIQDHQSPKLS